MGLHGLDEQVANNPREPLFWSGNVLVSMDQRGELSAVLMTLVRDQRVGLEHGFKTLACVSGFVA